MEFRILGSLEAEADGGRLSLSGPSMQKVLALLLLDANKAVPLSRLVDGLWDEDAPDTAVKQARNAVGRLRRVLAAGGEPQAIMTDGGGYRIRVADDALDAALFEGSVARAQRAASDGQLATAVELLRSALALWRSPFLAGMHGRIIETAATAWNERRYAVTELYYEHGLELGRHHEIIAELSAFASDHPLRERPAGQLMIALYRCGRQADALALYDRTRRLLADEMGVDPGPELRQLHQRILRSDATLTVRPQIQGERRSAARHAPDVVPRQLPAAVRHFAGRREELEVLARLLDQVEDTAAAVVISAIDGMAGIGKTTLAVHWAHRVAGCFPDGQLYVNLRGFDPAGLPLTPGQAIGGFLGALGVPATRLPANPEEQASLYRSMLAGKRVLVILDNAREEQQVRSLLPGGPGCLAVVTSRHPLVGLVASHGARPITLDVLTDDEARELLARRLGPERLAAEPDAVSELIGHCAKLPLALAIAAARAVTSSRLPLAGLAAELRDSRRRLDALDLTDTTMSVRHVFASSYHALSDEAARMFRLLGISPGPDISMPAAASLAACGQRRASMLLGELTRAHLLTEHIPGRYTFHDLLRTWAAELAHTCDSESDQREAVHRLLDYFLHTAAGAALALHPQRRPIALAAPQPGAECEIFPDDARALAWLESEYAVLLAAIRRAGQEELDVYVWQLSWALTDLLAQQGHWHDWVTVQRDAAAAAQRSGDCAGQAITLRALGQATATLGDYELARTYLSEALERFRDLCDPDGEAQIHGDLCVMCGLQGKHAEALGHARQALDISRVAGLRPVQAKALNSIGWCHAQLGDYQQALSFCEQALTLHRKLGSTFGEATTLDSLGYTHHHLGHHAQAIGCYQRALDLHARLGSRWQLTETLTRLGDAQLAVGNRAATAEAWAQALAILEDLEHPRAVNLRQELCDLRLPGVSCGMRDLRHSTPAPDPGSQLRQCLM